jgi:hypothetical protein
MAVSVQVFTVKVEGHLEAFSQAHAIAKLAAYLRSLSGEQPLPFSTQSDFYGIKVEINAGS